MLTSLSLFSDLSSSADSVIDTFFAALCRTARALCAAPAACVRIQGESACWTDLDLSLSPDAWAFVAMPVDWPMLWLADARCDPQGADWPWVAGAPGVRFVASIPFGPDGLGRLTVFDTRVRAESGQDAHPLADLAAIAGAGLALWQAGQVTARREAEFRLLAETSTDTIVRGNLDGVRLYVSPSVHALLGYAPEELVGRKAMELVHPEDAETFRALMQQVREGRLDMGLSEQRQRHRNGDWVWMEASIRLTRDATGQPTGYVASVRDIGRRKALEARLQEQASHDELTGLPNRLLFARRLDEALSHTRRDGRPLALLYMDLDGFKRVNDSLGHQLGDILLREVAARLRAALPAGALIARLGGDEFTVMLDGDADTAACVAGKLVAEIARPFQLGEACAAIGLSVGIASAPLHGLDADGVLSRADQALYQAKAAGRGVFRVSAPLNPAAPPP